MALLRSREVGEGPIKAGLIQVPESIRINGRTISTLASVTFDQQIRLVGFPPRAEMHITFGQLWLVNDPQTAPASRTIWLALIAANEGEATLNIEAFYQRFLDLIAWRTQTAGTVGNFTDTIIDGRQIWIDEVFNTLGGVALESVHDGLYLYARNSSGTDVTVEIVGRIHLEIVHHQMNYADDYTQDGQHFREGWAGYEWEESLGDAINDTNDEDL